MENRTARLTILIDPRKKKIFEEICASRDVTPSQVVRRLIRQWIVENADGQLPPVGILDDPLPDQPSDDLRWRHIAARANLLENLLLARIDENRQSGGSIFHGNTMIITLSFNSSTSI